MNSSISAVRLRLCDIDRAKGLAIFLVVYGHLIADSYPRGNLWYEITHQMVYSFHMPFFMFLSGVTAYYAYKPIHTFGEYISYTKRKFLRLGPAFFLFGVVILCGKLVAARFLHVDNVPTNLFDEFLLIAIKPSSSAASSLWYIYVLFEILILFPILLKILRGDVRLLLLLGLTLYSVNLTSMFLIDTVFNYLLFFAFGAVAVAYLESYLRILDKYKVAFWLIFALSFSTLHFNIEKQWCKLLVGTCSIPALHALMRTKAAQKMTFLTVLASMSFPIYLMNTIVIGFVKALALKLINWDYFNFLLIAPILLTCGLYGPILIKRHVISRISFIDRITT